MSTKVGILGIPFDANSSFMRGASEAPNRIREALHSSSSNLCSEDGRDLGAEPRLVDLGDVDLGDLGDRVNLADPKLKNGKSGFDTIETVISTHLLKGLRLLSLGGDHSVTYAIVKAYAKHYDQLNILHIDAHADLYDEFEGNRQSHACPFARIMENGLAKRLVQVGVRTLNPHQRNQAERFGVEMIEMKNWQDGYSLSFDGPLYVSFDMDALDPAFAPGVSHRESGGFSTRQVLDIIQNLDADVVGADIVELNPVRDTDAVGITAMAAAKILKELAAVMLR